MNRRRLMFHLTPLLDLLLIVLFAQQMEVQDRAAKDIEHLHAQVTREVEALQADRDKANVDLSKAKADLSKAKADLSKAKAYLDLSDDERAKQTRELNELREEAQRLKEELQDARQAAELAQLEKQRDRKRLSELMAEMLGVSADDLTEVTAALPEDVAKNLRKKAEELKRANPQALIRHLVMVEELLKQVDIWEIVVEGEGRIRLTVNNDDLGHIAQRDADSIWREMETRLSKVPQPKDLVLILRSHTGDAQRGTRRAFEAVLPKLRNWLSKAHANKRFVLPDIGMIDITSRTADKEKD